uniref:EBP50 C-terminal domain-containing protein n=1 Tax=Knipowitschia caucasica TaxID=637954 RepID=A0AAV2KK56_KNICA
MDGRERKEPERDSKLSVSPSPSNASSNTSLTTPPANTPPEGLITTLSLHLSLSLRSSRDSHQKRSNKRAQPID